MDDKHICRYTQRKNVTIECYQKANRKHTTTKPFLAAWKVKYLDIANNKEIIFCDIVYLI